MAEVRIDALRLRVPNMSRAEAQAFARQIAAELAARAGELPPGRIDQLTLRLPAADARGVGPALTRALRSRPGGERT